MNRTATLLLLSITTLGFVSGCNQNPGGEPLDTGYGTETGGQEPEDDGLVCPFSCSVDSDCCLGGAENFPGGTCIGSYPNNWECVAGSCVSQGCTTTSQCPLPDMQACVQLDGVGTCVYPCVNHPDCNDDYNLEDVYCLGTDDNQNSFCSQYDD